VIGSLFVTSGTTASQNQQRQQSATLAIEEINKVGGIPTATEGISRPLVMVSCDETNMIRAATHLVSDVRVPAIVGPNLSQDTIDISNNVTAGAGVLVVSPTAVAASIAGLRDNGLTWLMIPSDAQRGPLMIQQINELETQLKSARSKDTIKFSIIYRDDAMGQGTQTSLNSLHINGNTLSAELGNGNVKVSPYTSTQTDFSAIISEQVAFAPDIIVLAGTAETVTVMTGLEAAWNPDNPRPYYLGIDPFKGPQLLTAVTGNDDLRRRWRGTGTKPGPDKAEADNYNAFQLAYNGRYPGTQATASGCGSSYDASYAIAYALAATKDLPVTGANIAQGLRKLSGGATAINTGSVLTAFQKLAAGESINGAGTLCPLAWDENGSVSAGTVEVWCIGLSSATPPVPQYQSSGVTLDIQTQSILGSYTQCGP
jgi:branched-chain amino acid transport system substrate-binding protein